MKQDSSKHGVITKVIVSGRAAGRVLKTVQPINFLGTVDKKTGVIQDKHHELFERSIKDSILVFPNGIGSSVGAYTIYSIKSNDVAPFAMVCKKADLTVATGCALANIPMVVVENDVFDSLASGDELAIDTERKKIVSL